MMPVERKPYFKPSIRRISFADAAKIKGSYLRGRAATEIDGHNVGQLLSEYGSPLYVVSEKTLRSSCRTFYSAFARRYPHTVIAYSYKTNYLGGICAVLHQEGAWAEVVSGFEYEMARRLGVKGENIIFNGPYKKPVELGRAFDDGALVHLDSADDFRMAERVAETRGRKASIGIRVNMQLNYPAWDKFGFGFENGQAYDICRQLSRHKYLQLQGLHCHVGTYVIDVAVYRKAMENLMTLASRIRKSLGIELTYLDMGGGFPSANTLQTQLMPAETITPGIDQYAEALCDVLTAKSKAFDKPLRLILEPGRSVVDESMSLLSRVVAVKERENGSRFAIIDAGVNLLPTAYYYKHAISSNRDASQSMEQIDVFGPLCMQIDVIRKDAMLPVVETGDILTIKNVGAYNFSQSMPFIFMRPAVVSIHDGTVDILRRAETFDDIKGLESVPPRLLFSGKSP